MKININVFYKLIVSLWMCAARHAQSTQNNKFVMSLQCRKENMMDEFFVFTVDKYHDFLQIDAIILGVLGQPCPN